jgi:hypothetical protein
VSSLLCLGGCGFPVIGALFAYLAGRAIDEGNVADAEAKLKWSKILSVIGPIITLVLLVLAVAAFGANISELFEV